MNELENGYLYLDPMTAHNSFSILKTLIHIYMYIHIYSEG